MGRDDRDGDRRSNYGINTNILVAAIVSLSIAVIIVITLHIYARWVLRRQARRQAALTRLAIIITNSTTNDTAAAAAAAAASEPPKTSLDPAAIAAMPSFLFKRADDSTEHTECSVCLSSLEDGEKARTLPNCGHTFHADCVDKWFGSNSTCPVCRAEALPRLVQEAVPTAPPLEGTSCQDGSGRIQCSAKIGSSGSGSMLSSFRRMIVGERSSRRMRVPSSCGVEEGLAAGDLERQ